MQRLTVPMVFIVSQVAVLFSADALGRQVCFLVRVCFPFGVFVFGKLFFGTFLECFRVSPLLVKSALVYCNRFFVFKPSAADITLRQIGL
jgi:hypothetical protein